MDRQDRQPVRTAAELERKYNFGKSFAELRGIALDAQTHAYNAEDNLKALDLKLNEFTMLVTTDYVTKSELKITADEIKATVSDSASKSELQVLSDAINLKVSNVEGDIGKLSVTATEINGKVTNMQGQVGELSVKAGEITAKVTEITDTYAKKSEIIVTPDDITLAVTNATKDFVKKGEVVITDEQIRAAVSETLDGTYVKQSELTLAAEGIQAQVTEITENYAKKSALDLKADIASLSVYATTTDLASYATKSELQLKADSASLGVYALKDDLGSYATKSELSLKADSASLGVYALKDDLGSYATKSELSLKADSASLGVYATKDDLNSYATKSELQLKADSASLSVYAQKDELAGLNRDLSAKIDVKLDTIDLISQINMVSNEITITSDNFTLTAEGDITAYNGKFCGSIVARNDFNAKKVTLINENGIYFGNSFKTNAPSYIGDSQCAISMDDDGVWGMANISIFRAPTITVTEDSYTANGIWYQRGWTITPDSISCRLLNATNNIYVGDARLAVSGDWYASGTWYFSSGTTLTSDVNYKHDIATVPEEYAVLFDNLRAVRYKYNDGTSDRYHIGYIAQEVDEALHKAGLTRQDFAGICIMDEGTEEEKWTLRYSEFISLNTYEIQKLKARVAELEKRIGA